ncbi:MAG: class I SAM-dependent methyltransferase [Candidatus Bathyarchaeia archaeon]
MQVKAKCPLCNSYRSNFLLKGKDYRYHTVGEFPLWECEDCGLIFQKNFLDAFSGQCTKGEECSCEYSAFYKIFTWLVNIERLHFLGKHKARGRVFDIGCGNGDFLFQAGRKGWDVFGNEISPFAYEETCKKIDKHRIWFGDLCELPLRNGEYDAVTMHHVLEHVDYPRDLMKAVNKMLKDDGILIIETPHIPNPVFQIFGKYYFHLDLPRHKCLFRYSTLKRLLHEEGFEIVHEDIPSWHFPESIGMSILFALSHDDVKSEKRIRKMIALLFSIPMLFAKLLMEKIGITPEIIRIVAKKECKYLKRNDKKQFKEDICKN